MNDIKTFNREIEKRCVWHASSAGLGHRCTGKGSMLITKQANFNYQIKRKKRNKKWDATIINNFDPSEALEGTNMSRTLSVRKEFFSPS